ncbi:hypothetical protein J31TS4_36000 [Paenibacillus sp. J31TS4]|uniref:PH domain-containing protein n=1 Tax=Paenibacillus sp. J31TS4 TaxID=2807195 RepID=UPI001B25CE05|nr:PH domain-containing protein [Paenibacillus sp. J31TS4]GIP40320.1 hypothetical protein J31TS4_36000 [Paenibacillus sp. J31TS4]
MRFAARRDRWLSVVIWATVALLLLSGLSPLVVGGAGWVGGTILFLVCASFAWLTGSLWVATYYELGESELYIRIGPMARRIPYEQIRQAKPVRSWGSIAATSRQRVEILYGNYEVIYVSPLERELFLKELQKRSPRATIELRENPGS